MSIFPTGRGFRGRVGPVGYCVCPSCGYTMPHQVGVPCINTRCPRCGTNMIRV